MSLPLWWGLKQHLFFDLICSIEYLASTVTVVSANPSVGPLPITNISLLSAFVDELSSTPKIITLLPQ